MDKSTFNTAIELDSDVRNLNKIIEECRKEHHWVRVITPHTCKSDTCFSVRFQHELVDFLEDRVRAYQEEFEKL